MSRCAYYSTVQHLSLEERSRDKKLGDWRVFDGVVFSVLVIVAYLVSTVGGDGSERRSLRSLFSSFLAFFSMSLFRFSKDRDKQHRPNINELLNAIGQQTIERKRNQKVMYFSSERFTNEFIDAIQHNMLVRFRKRHRQTDVLLIDDIQFLAGKERSQEEFFHTFNTLFDGRKQIGLK